jgi:hypothetical protein
MGELTDRLTCAATELERLRGDRQELGHQIRFMHDLLVMKLTGKRGQCEDPNTGILVKNQGNCILIHSKNPQRSGSLTVLTGQQSCANY